MNKSIRFLEVIAGLVLCSYCMSGCGSGNGIEGPFVLTRVTVPSSNTPPTVDAGPDQNVLAGDTVILVGSAHDDQWVNRTEWRQNLGPVVSLSYGGTVLEPSFVAPPVSELTELRFVLRAFDNQGQVGSDETSVFVEPIGGAPPAVPPGSYTLDFESLPSAQGWTYIGAAIAENVAFSVDASRLLQRTVGSGPSSTARYQIDNAASSSMTMTLSLTVRVLGHEDFSGGSVGLGLNFYISDGAFSHRLALTDALIQVGGQFYGLNTKDFHDYRLKMHPGGGFDLYVDGAIFATGIGSDSISGNKIFFGDSTVHENTDAQITALSYVVGTNE